MAAMSASEDTSKALISNIEMDQDRFVELLTKLIDKVETLQNNPSQASEVHELTQCIRLHFSDLQTCPWCACSSWKA